MNKSQWKKAAYARIALMVSQDVANGDSDYDPSVRSREDAQRLASALMEIVEEMERRATGLSGTVWEETQRRLEMGIDEPEWMQGSRKQGGLAPAIR